MRQKNEGISSVNQKELILTKSYQSVLLVSVRLPSPSPKTVSAGSAIT